MHTDDMNDFVMMGLARDSAEAEVKQLRETVAALEDRIAKADALAEVAERAIKLSQEHDSFKLYAMEPMWQALAAYREGSDT